MENLKNQKNQTVCHVLHATCLRKGECSHRGGLEMES